jgi:hypothetical protein
LAGEEGVLKVFRLNVLGLEYTVDLGLVTIGV